MSRNRVSNDFASVWFDLYFGDDAPPPSVTEWYLVPVLDYARQRPEYDCWYQATVDGKQWALAGRVAPRLWLAKVPGGYHVRRDDRYINVTPDMVDDAVFMLCLDALEREGE